MIFFVWVELLFKENLFDYSDGFKNFSVYEIIVLKLGVEK